MAHPHGRNPSAKLRALADHLKETLSDPPYWDRAGLGQSRLIRFSVTGERCVFSTASASRATAGGPSIGR
ncbi:hypothetical protein EV129_104188 [Rhizobium azibense]|uniref:Uncharacterized protein n=1 Tax=Rhizobium azibense TaxID=1136135 RepID=A0A4R3RU20_9HYPH|nr:hypothetical protein EV129_104188 [Rhizobium azibense]